MTTTEDDLALALVERLDEDTKLSLDSKVLVYAAFEGETALAAAITSGGVLPSVDEFAAAADAPDPAGAYLTRVTVSGFRGVGPERSIDVKPAPGLTVICGRNGSGKSTFAEAVEMALTGHNERWSEDRAAEWRDGWRNLHVPHPTAIEVQFLVEGQAPAQTVVRRRWQKDGDLKSATAEVQSAGQPVQPIALLGWQQPIETYRPFLTYNELGDALTGRPSALYDALWKILGLERITTTQARLQDATKRLKDAAEAAKSGAALLVVQARGLTRDDRAEHLIALLDKKTWDIDAIEAAVHDDGHDDSSGLGILRQLASLQGPDLQAISDCARTLRESAGNMQALKGTDAERCALDADLLDKAVAHHETTGDGPCPVCGSRDLDAMWHAEASARVAELRAKAAEVLDARGALHRALQSARALVTSKPVIADQVAAAGLVVTNDLSSAWQTFAQAPSDPVDLAKHLEDHGTGLAVAVDEISRAANEQYALRQNAWRPVAHAVQAWLPKARTAQAQAPALVALTAASTWVKAAATDWANARLAPLSDQSGRIWEQLRQESNVSLGPVHLEGSGNRRKVRLDVSVDGAAGSALGVMSQGELHALALALFLPRATVPTSPFRFLVIDDPVQAMDPAKVDGLAMVLDEVARRRQVIVFTHDDRLPAAIRRLRLPATLLEVTRRASSVVDVVAAEDPALRHLRDARSLIKDPKVDPRVSSRVVPGLCRLALEAACLDRFRAGRLATGASHADVERVIEANPKLYSRMAMALFDDPDKGGQVLARLNQFGGWAGDVFKACNQGAHHAVSRDDLADLVANAASLVKKLQQ